MFSPSGGEANRFLGRRIHQPRELAPTSALRAGPTSIGGRLSTKACPRDPCRKLGVM
jgi:hypothetical protein